MTDSRIHQLLEDLMESGRTPEEVCRAHPELLLEVQERWRRVRLLMEEIETVFPAAGSEQGRNLADLTPPHRWGESPAVPGYDVLEVLGRGGMGVVYKARHQRLNRVVAIKMLVSGEYASTREVQRLLLESEVLASLRHPNIVQVFDVGDLEGCPYFTMEFMEGGTLAQLLAGSPRPSREAASLLATLARAVQAVHDAGIVHRDLKPSNVLLAADGTPKVADCGVARRLASSAGITISGVRVGTPSYMAPEQAVGGAGAAAPAVDVYSLGAILYEVLTGRPPFRSETPEETARQLLVEEPVPPFRLNPTVPRDLNTICLKCLSKDPQRRYVTASALAGDLRRFLNHEPIHARRIGQTARVLRWVRRKPTAAALVATALAMIGLALGGGTLLVQQRAERRAELRSDVGTAVTLAVSLRQEYHFGEARELLRQARQRLEPAGPDDLRQQVDQAAADLELAENLDMARQRAAILVGGRFDIAGAEPLYIDVFAEAGLGGPGNDSQAVAARVRDSPVRTEIVAALDDWASITQDDTRRAWLLAIARDADPDPSGDHLRRPELWQDGPELANLAHECRVEELSPQLLTALGRVLNRAGGASALPLLSAAQAIFPDDFWLNFELASAWNESGRNDEALGFYRAALALRPEASSAHQALALNLTDMGRLNEAIGHYEKALAIDPTFALAHNNCGVALHDGGRSDEAIAHFEEAVRLDPDESARARASLGTVLRAKGRLDEAIGHLEESIRLDPNGAVAHFYLGQALGDKDRFVEAIGHIQQALHLDPRMFVARQALRECQFDAACAAVLASADQGLRETRFDQWEPADLRRQALEWLRANLELRAMMLNDGTAADWDPSLSTWQTEPALAGVRDRTALAKLGDAERQQWQRLWADVAALLATEPAEVGLAHAARRDWNKAANSYARALELRPTDSSHFWFEYAALLLLSGDRTGYAGACARMVELCSEGNMRAYHAARACTLAPDAGVEASLPRRLAETELENSAGQFWSLTQQGALHYRAGRFPEAVVLFEQSLRTDTRPGSAVLNWLWLALANERLGKSEEAHHWLDTATAWLDQFRDGMPSRAEEELGLHLHNWLEAHILRREAESVILRPAPDDAQDHSTLEGWTHP